MCVIQNKTLVLAPSYQTAQFWCDYKYKLDTRNVNVVVMTRYEHLKGYVLEDLPLFFSDLKIIYGEESDYPEKVLDIEDYHSFRKLCRDVERVFNEVQG